MSSSDDLVNHDVRSPPRAAGRPRLTATRRRAQIVAEAAAFFAEHGLEGQTRELAAACGVSQRLLYKMFPNKAALVNEVFAAVVLAPIRVSWAVGLSDRRQPIEQRLLDFYTDYIATVFSREWTRLFMFGALVRDSRSAEAVLPPDYGFPILLQLIETVAVEACAALDLPAPTDAAEAQQLGWLLHGLVSHAALRRQLLKTPNGLPPQPELQLVVACFLGGLPAASAVLRAARPQLQVTPMVAS